MHELPLTPSQTVGPFFHLALAGRSRQEVGAAVDAARTIMITIRGEVLDGDGAPVSDAVVETWQHGGPFARCPTGSDGVWEVRVPRPVTVPTLDGTPQAPHLAVSVFARGLLDRVVTRAYLDDDPANGADPVLQALGDRAATLIARSQGDAAYRFDIRLQGPDETVFFAI